MLELKTELHLFEFNGFNLGVYLPISKILENIAYRYLKSRDLRGDSHSCRHRQSVWSDCQTQCTRLLCETHVAAGMSHTSGECPKLLSCYFATPGYKDHLGIWNKIK